MSLQRCPRCGNENPADNYTCSFCGKRLRIERIENFSIFKRIEIEWITPDPWYLLILFLFIRPNYAFWSINHKRDKAPGLLILLFNSLIWGLMGLAIISHFNPLVFELLLIGFGFFVAFFLFGLIFQMIFFSILIWLFTKGANYAVDFSERLEARFGAEKEEEQKYTQQDLSPFSIYRGGILLQKQEANKFGMMLCAYAPFLLINFIKVLVLLIGLPTAVLSIEDQTATTAAYQTVFNSPIWAVVDILDALTIAIWVPILTALAIRELSNSSTIRVLISSIIVGILAAIIIFFMRPTLFGAFI